MSQSSAETQRKSGMDSIGSALSHWKQRLAELPEVRADKIQTVRGAIRSSYYETEQVLDCTVQQLSNEIGVLCRNDSSTGSA